MNAPNESSRERDAFLGQLPAAAQHLDDPISALLLKEYGSVFVTKATPPPAVVFRDERQVEAFQESLETATQTIGGFELTLQASAMATLLSAMEESREAGLDINPRGADSAARTYADTVVLWSSRVEPALDHWVANGRLHADHAEHIRSLSPSEQVPVVLELEAEGIYFSKDLSKSIIYSVAPPGTSQHLSLLAFDVKEFTDPTVCAILAGQGWFQTVISDLPHFTYLGTSVDEHPSLGLKRVESAGRIFWVPNV